MSCQSQVREKRADLDGVDGADGDPGDGHAGEYVTADLEEGHGEGVADDSGGRGPYAGEADEGAGEDEAVGGDEAELDKGEGDGEAELREDGLAGVGGERGGQAGGVRESGGCRHGSCACTSLL